MIVKQVLDGLKFNGHVVLIFQGRILTGGNPARVCYKYGCYEVSYSCIQDNTLIINCK